MRGSLFIDKELKRASHTQCSSIGDFVIYSEYCLAPNIVKLIAKNNFVKYILSLKIQHTGPLLLHNSYSSF